MFEISIQAEFCAAHALVLSGRRERTHGHNFRVTATVGAARLDGDGLVCDFHEVERALAAIIEPFRDRDLNQCPPFDTRNPSAEAIAKHISDGLSAALPGASGRDAGRGLRVVSVSITEAPGCVATHRSAAAREESA